MAPATGLRPLEPNYLDVSALKSGQGSWMEGLARAIGPAGQSECGGTVRPHPRYPDGGGPAMRTFILVLAMIALTGCTFKSATVKHVAEPPPTVVPATVAYEVNNQVDYDQAARQADDWCRQKYGARAHYLNRQPAAVGAVVTFECI